MASGKVYFQEAEALEEASETTDLAQKAFVLGDYKEGAKQGRRSFACFREAISSLAKDTVYVCKLRSFCHEYQGNPAWGYNAILTDYLSVMSDVMEKGNVSGLQLAYLDRYGVQPKLANATRGKLEAMIESLQKILDCEDDSRQVKKRRIQPDGAPQKLDPLSFGLPNEITSYIFNLLGSYDQGRAACVSRQWYTCVLTLSNFLTEPNFCSNAAISDMANYLQTCKRLNVKKVKFLRLPWLRFNQGNILMKQFSEVALQIQDLEIEFTGDVSWPSDTECTDLLMYSLSELHSLYIYVSPKESSDLRKLLRCLPSLKNLTIRFNFFSPAGNDNDNNDDVDDNMDGNENDSEDDDDDDGMTLQGISANNLDKLRISMVGYRKVLACIENFIENSTFHNVRQLELEGVPLSSHDLKKIIHSAHPKKLLLETGYSIDICEVAKSCMKSQLSCLDLKFGRLDDQQMSVMDLSSFSGLQQLKLRQSNLSTEALLTLLEATGGSLKELVLDMSTFYAILRNNSLLTDMFRLCPLLEILDVESVFSNCKDLFTGLADALSSLPRFRTLRLSGLLLDMHFASSLFPPGSCPRSFNVEYISISPLKAGTVNYLESGRYCSRIRWMGRYEDILESCRLV